MLRSACNAGSLKGRQGGKGGTSGVNWVRSESAQVCLQCWQPEREAGRD